MYLCKPCSVEREKKDTNLDNCLGNSVCVFKGMSCVVEELMIRDRETFPSSFIVVIVTQMPSWLRCAPGTCGHISAM